VSNSIDESRIDLLGPIEESIGRKEERRVKDESS
jgi:hypothetical protein